MKKLISIFGTIVALLMLVPIGMPMQAEASPMQIVNVPAQDGGGKQLTHRRTGPAMLSRGRMLHTLQDPGLCPRLRLLATLPPGLVLMGS
jgi:hypothetical protein